MISDSSISMNGADENSALEGDEDRTPANGIQSPAAAAEELQAKLQDAEKKYLYLYSEFENFRRRNERDRLDYIKFGHEGFLKDLLQVLDNFERAITHAKSQGGEKGSPLASVAQGIEMIHYQFAEALKNQGATPVVSLGQKFDPALHEAVSEEDSASSEPGTVLKELQKGYTLHGRLLRPARVVLAKKA